MVVNGLNVTAKDTNIVLLNYLHLCCYVRSEVSLNIQKCNLSYQQSVVSKRKPLYPELL